MAMKESTILSRLEMIDRLLNLKKEGVTLDSYYNRPSFFLDKLNWMHKFKHIDYKTYCEYVDKVFDVFER